MTAMSSMAPALADENPFHQALAIEVVFLICFAGTLLHISRKPVALRLPSSFILAFLSYKLHQAFLRGCLNPHWRAIAAPLIWIQLMSATELVLISRVDAGELCPNTAHNRSFGQLRRAITMLWNLRRVGTKWDVSVSPTAAAGQHRRREYHHFIRNRLLSTFLAYLVLDIMISAPAPDPKFVAAEKQTLFKPFSFSAEDTIFRGFGTIASWFCAFLLILIMSNSVALIWVGTGLSSLASCPPLFGPIYETYTIRQFWGVLWHQLLRRGLTGHADLITSTALTLFLPPSSTPTKLLSPTALTPFLPPSSTSTKLLSRYTRLFLAFLISGLIHHASDLAMGISPSDTGAVCFFVLQAVGIMVEDAAQSISGSALHPYLRRICGYVWVVLFLAWTTPTWFYPQQRLRLDAEDLLPFRVVGPALAFLSGR